MRSLGEIEVIKLSIDDAWRMPEDELRAFFNDIVLDLRGTFPDDFLPASFPRDPYGMSRAAILAAVQKHQYWFNPPEPKPSVDMQRAD